MYSLFSHLHPLVDAPLRQNRLQNIVQIQPWPYRTPPRLKRAYVLLFLHVMPISSSPSTRHFLRSGSSQMQSTPHWLDIRIDRVVNGEVAQGLWSHNEHAKKKTSRPVTITREQVKAI